MKIDRIGSLKFKQSSKRPLSNMIIKKIAIGTIMISIFMFMSNHSICKSYNQPNTSQSNSVAMTNNTVMVAKEPSVPTPKPTSKPKEEQTKKMVTLSYDDGPSKTYTPQLLKILKDNDCTATFFVLGNRVKQYSDIIYQSYSNGNEIGNHSYDHSYLTKLTKDQVLKQVKLTSDSVFKVIKQYPTFVRPPYGAISKEIESYIGYPLALWSIDSNDWRKISDKQVMDNVTSELGDGKIIIMHDIYKRTIDVSKILIPKIKELGYKIVSLKELYKAKNIKLENGHVYSKTKKN